MTNINFPIHHPVEPGKPHQEISFKEINKSALAVAASVVSSLSFGPGYAMIGALLTRTANLLTGGRVPCNIPMFIAATAATYYSPAILQTSLAAADLAATGALAGYQMASTAVQFIANNPDKVAQFATDTLKTTMPHLAVPAALFTAVALSRPKTQSI